MNTLYYILNLNSYLFHFIFQRTSFGFSTHPLHKIILGVVVLPQPTQMATAGASSPCRAFKWARPPLTDTVYRMDDDQ